MRVGDAGLAGWEGESGCTQCTQTGIRATAAAAFLSVLAGDPIENLRGSYGFLRRMGIQCPGNRAPALFDDFLGKSARFGFILEFARRAGEPSLSIVALRRYVRAVGNVPDEWLGQAIGLEEFPSDAISEGNHRRDPS